MRITGGVVFDENKGFICRDLFIKDQTIVNCCNDDLVLDARELYLLPGLCDIHLHGAMGYDFMDGTPDTLHKIASFEASHGITTFCPASMTMGADTILSAMRYASSFSPAADEAAMGGIYMEGPFISKDKCGAQDPAHIQAPSVEFLKLAQKTSGERIRFVTVAPEATQALKFIQELKQEIRISLAHTTCDYHTACDALRAGAVQLTHLYNAMPPLLARAPGPIAAGADYGADAEIICDGIHVHAAAVRVALALYGRDHLIMISDSMRACGLADGEYTLGGQKVQVSGKKACLSDGTIAGSVTCLYDCFRNAVMQMQIPLYDAICAAALNPLRILNLLPSGGIFSEGAPASLLLCDKHLALKAVILRGQVIKGADFIRQRKSQASMRT